MRKRKTKHRPPNILDRLAKEGKIKLYPAPPYKVLLKRMRHTKREKLGNMLILHKFRDRGRQGRRSRGVFKLKMGSLFKKAPQVNLRPSLKRF